ncbi:MAG: hypothetical protein RL199_1481 [Pseudomonadota bacterium]|jgi:hypothetical protein
MKTHALVLSLVATALGAVAAATPMNPSLTCEPDEPRLDKYAFLRALSLDLRGTPPTPAEYAALEAESDVTDGMLDTLMRSEEFVGRAVRRHRDLFWSSLGLINFGATGVNLGGSPLFRKADVAKLLRGGPDAGKGCLDEPAVVVDGVIQTRMVDGYAREGYVWVAPYWAPNTQVKVCAYDARSDAFAPSGADCSTPAGMADPGCGCGPNLKYCWNASLAAEVKQAFVVDFERRLADIFREDRPYSELFLGRTAWVNGPIVHFWKYLARFGSDSGISYTPSPMPDVLPDLDYTQADVWREVDLPEGHAGLLTSPVYLMRFMTNRSRANRFYNAFLCQPFQPPASGIPIEPAGTVPDPDLQLRHGCNYCHAVLEPAASHWGRWGEKSTSFLSPQAYPPHRPDCDLCARTGNCSDQCRRAYITRSYSLKEDQYLGLFNPYVFRRPEHMNNVEQGPRLLALQSLVDGRLSSCSARRMIEFFLGREVSGVDEEAWVSSVAEGFVQSGLSYRALVRSVVTSDTYRRVR